MAIKCPKCNEGDKVEMEFAAFGSRYRCKSCDHFFSDKTTLMSKEELDNIKERGEGFRDSFVKSMDAYKNRKW